MKRDAVLNARIPADLREAVERAADDDGRSISGMVVAILRAWCIEHNYLRPVDLPLPRQSKSKRS